MTEVSYKVNFNKIKGCFNLELNFQEEKYKETNESVDCPICFDEFEENIEVIKLPCNHIYHKDCITQWFSRSLSCPNCRIDLNNNNKKFTGVNFSDESLILYLPSVEIAPDFIEYWLTVTLSIDEAEKDHFTQILFMLKESFYNIEERTVDWKPFTKDYIIDICKADERIYIENWSNGLEYIDEFPEKIDEFIESYCDVLYHSEVV